MSIVANIAEGYGRKSKRDFKRYLTIAIGSVNEVKAFLDIIKVLYPKVNVEKECLFFESLGKQIWSFRQKL
jgi:four helix bundle protein